MNSPLALHLHQGRVHRSSDSDDSHSTGDAQAAIVRKSGVMAYQRERRANDFAFTGIHDAVSIPLHPDGLPRVCGESDRANRRCTSTRRSGPATSKLDRMGHLDH